MILFKEIIFGPIKSRRFGVSLGINLLPLENKICNFDCIYCECGWTDLKTAKKYFFPKEEVLGELERTLKENLAKKREIECLTFAGNGEPTMHPDFLEIMKGTLKLRSKYYPASKVVVLSNSALLSNKKVVEALLLADLRVMKLDVGTEKVYQKINKPLSKITLSKVVKQLRQFKGDLYIQSLFLRAPEKGSVIDNTTNSEVAAWLKLLTEIKPAHVMIYTVDREAPMKSVEKISAVKLNEIRDKVNALGLSAEVYT